MRSLKQRSNRRINSRKQQAGDGNHNIQSVGMPIQYFNPSAKFPAYYPSGHEMLTKQYVSGLGPVNAVNTTQPNACGTEMGPSLSAFSPYEDVSMMTGGSAYRQIVNPLTNRKVSIRSRLGQQIIKQYANLLEGGSPPTAAELEAARLARQRLQWELLMLQKSHGLEEGGGPEEAVITPAAPRSKGLAPISFGYAAEQSTQGLSYASSNDSVSSK
jgi:hypothetical protein